MRIYLIFLFLSVIPTSAWSQEDFPSNSFELSYKKTNPEIIYDYDSIRQIHNYSNNWDFDKDGVKDQIYFIGTGGAHLYYFLRVILSSDNIKRDFPFIQLDAPVLPSDKELSKTDFNPKKSWVHFAVFDCDKDNRKDIFIKLDNSSFDVEKNILKSKGIKTNLIMLTFKNGRTIFRDFFNAVK